MFNRQPYNRGKFNKPSVQTTSISGLSVLKLSGEPVKPQQVMISYGMSALMLQSTSNATNIKNSGGSITLILDSKISPTKIHYGIANISDIQLQTKGEHTLAGEERISLPGLVLKPGDELVIDTCEMTVSVNGQNMMKFVSDDSEFFSLLPGDNEIIYTDGVTTRKVSIDILWKDRWV